MRKHSAAVLALGTIVSLVPPPVHALPPPGGPVGRKCGFNSTTDVTREAGWQTGDINVGPLLTGEDGTLTCTILVNADTHNSGNIRAQKSFSSIGGVVVGADTLNYQATAADDVSLCTKWTSAGQTLYWTGENPPGLGFWSTNAGATCGVALSIEPNDPECSIWKAIDRRLGTNIAEIWQDCEPYEEFPLPIADLDSIFELLFGNPATQALEDLTDPIVCPVTASFAGDLPGLRIDPDGDMWADFDGNGSYNPYEKFEDCPPYDDIEGG